MRLELFFVALLLARSLLAGSPAAGQTFDSPAAAAADADFLVQGEYAGNNQGMQVIARGAGEFEIVVYAIGLPGAGWDKSPPRRVDGDADTVSQLVESMNLKRVERQSPTLGSLPPPGAIVLFDGSEASLKNNWSDGAKRTDNGLLMQGATSKQTFSDYRLHIEFMTPFMPNAEGQGRGNSGVYHQGRYETQVLDSFGLAGKNNEAGGIYEVRDPDLNMCLPPLTWQTYDVEFTAATFDNTGKKIANARLTVSLNGVTVQTAVEVPHPTAAAPVNESPQPGPIFLQDHGNPVRFRNIWVVPRDVVKESRRPIVAGYERMFADSDPKLLGGKLLVDTLGCNACHGAASSMASQAGPVLDDVAGRVRFDHLVDFITSPRDVKVGTTMPDPWHGLAEDKRRESALAIANYLVAGKSEALEQIGDNASADRGSVLYHNQGCVACHAPIKGNDNANVTSTSVPLGKLSAKYTLSSLKKFLLDPVAVRPCGRMPKVVASAVEAHDVATFLLRDVVVVPGGELIRRKVYRGDWDRLPDMDSLTPTSADRVDSLKIDDIDGTFAASFDAFLPIAEAGKYTFRLTSDDGARLIIDDKTVIDHDGIHPESEKKNQIKLDAGVHSIRVLYFEGGGQRALELTIESDSAGPATISSMLCATIDGTVKRLVLTNFKPDATLVAKGSALFASAGCANCHSKTDSNRNSNSIVKAKPLMDCQPGAGCLANEVPPGLPDYQLTSTQRQRIALAMGASAALAASGADLLHYQMASLNCYACHVRDGVGGPDATRNSFFTTTTPEMGDEGRLPPNLSGVGDKLTDAYLRDVLIDGADERPYMKTRMPGFGKAIPDTLISTLIEADRRDDRNDGKSITTGEGDLLADGRVLCGNEGLACIKCHTFGGVGLPGIQAIDMLRMPQRLRRDWFERYLVNPQAYRPGTRMPASFIDGKSALTRIADGRPADQIEAMWRYLNRGHDAKPPSGLQPDAIELKDSVRPVIYRNFFADVSPRGIAVGYPEAVNLIWDAQRMTLASVWKNGFIDASMHWSGRGQGNQSPLGDAVTKVDSDTPVAMLADASLPWPKDLTVTNAYRFLGYKLDKSGRPTFRYLVGDVTVEDKIEPLPRDVVPRSMDRQLRFTGHGNVTFLVAKGDVQSITDGWYSVDNRYRVRITSGEGQLMTFGSDKELRVNALLRQSQPTTIIVQLAW